MQGRPLPFLLYLSFFYEYTPSLPKKEIIILELVPAGVCDVMVPEQPIICTVRGSIFFIEKGKVVCQQVMLN